MQAMKLPRKRPSLFRKVSSILRTSILVARMRKSILQKLVVLKNSRKIKRLRLIKHYNYGFLEEYEFSPSSTPLIHFPGKHLKNTGNTEKRYSMLFLCWCLGGLEAEGGGKLEYRLSIDSLPVITGAHFEPLDFGDEEDSVDQRAERFIERFYQEIRMQRQESI